MWYAIFADLFEFAVLHLDSSMILDLLSDVPVSSDCGILSSEVVTLLNSKIYVKAGVL